MRLVAENQKLPNIQPPGATHLTTELPGAMHFGLQVQRILLSNYQVQCTLDYKCNAPNYQTTQLPN
ncbi:MAG: hypothetical protein B6I38_10195 [Anaerolineaceae bacterium 4572_5.1]|nr:MAG: hypothetical protein B6I38_10195 [Anaerolineaceae bacterium 4572_5.1]RLD02683.1 MAG: hypothetical protein DRI56_13795 [Chloroflexota bacterium]